MSIKKKLGMGIAAGALGMSLVGGGSYAAFNDVETTSNTFASGTLDLTVDKEVVFDLENLKPGDTFSETLKLGSNGSLNINQILASFSTDGWTDETDSKLPNNGENSKAEFLSQFDVTVTSDQGANWNGTLDQAMNLSNFDVTQSGSDTVGLAAEDSVTFTIDVEFTNVDDTYSNSRLQTQNKFQNERVDLTVDFEATQMDGENRNND